MIVGNAIFTLLFLLVIAGGVAVVVGKLRFEAPGPLADDKVVNIPRSAGVMDIADILQREGVVDQHKLVFVGGVAVLKARGELKSGEYQFAKRASLRDVVETLVEGKVVQHLITVPEGLTSEQIVARLLETQMLAGTIKEVPREGTLLPDTYNFTRGDTARGSDPAHAGAQQRVLKEVWDRRARTCRYARRSNSWCSPRSSRRKPASPRSARGSPRCSSTG